MREHVDTDLRAVEPELHREWASRWAPLGLNWEDTRLAFRFGWEHSVFPSYAEYDWQQAEPDLAQHWYLPLEADENENMDWDSVRDVVHLGWDWARRKRHG
jgi:hypothetical protein